MLVILGPYTRLPDVLWMFSHLKDENSRLALNQNPHFYRRLPIFPEAYEGKFRMKPVKIIQHEVISVLVDNPGHAGRVYIETAREVRVFGNAWDTNDTIIFKGSCILYFFPPSLTLCQTSVEVLRVKALLRKPSKVYPTYGVLKSLLNQRFYVIITGTAPHRPHPR